MRRWGGVTIGLLPLLSLNACATPSVGPDVEAVQDWQEGWNIGRVGPDVLVSFSGTGSIEAYDEDNKDGAGASSALGAAYDVTALEFLCFGSETLSVNVTLSPATGAVAGRTGDLACVESPHVLSHVLDAVTEVTMSGVTGAGPTGARGVVVRGGS